MSFYTHVENSADFEKSLLNFHHLGTPSLLCRDIIKCLPDLRLALRSSLQFCWLARGFLLDTNALSVLLVPL